jgi:mycofactocin system glycosyltransferase
LNREETPVPDGFRLVIDPDVRRPSWKVVVGGAPLRVLRLGEGGARLLDGWEAGARVGGSAGEPAGESGGGSRAAGLFARRLVDAGIAHPRPDPEAVSEGVTDASGLTVVIPVRDNTTGLVSTLARLQGMKVVVVDDGSTVPVAVADLPGDQSATDVSVIRHDHPRGPAAARNSGWRAATSDVVVFLDADCVPTGDWLATLVGHLADPAVAAVGPRIVSPAAREGALAAYESVRSSLDLGARESPVRPRSRVPYVPTACLAVRRQALLEVGGFDEKLRFGEDVDLVWRLNDAGWSVRYEPRASVVHPARSGFGAWLRQRFDYGRSAAPLAERHGAAVAPLAVSPWSAGAWSLALAGQPLAALGMVAATAGILARRARGDRSTETELARLAVRGSLLAGARIAESVRRAWLPPALVVATVTRPGRSRRRVAAGIAAAFAAPLVEWVARRPPLDAVSWVSLRAADDLAYQAGVWAGALRAKSPKALLPDF